MNLATVKKLTAQLTKSQKVKLVGDLLSEVVPQFRQPISLSELERRAEDVVTGRTKAIAVEVFDAELDEMEKSIDSQRRFAHRV